MQAEADMGLTMMAMGRVDPNDSKLFVKFENFPHLDPDASAAEGRPIFKDKEYITIIVPGDKDNIVHRPVWEADTQRFPQQYRAFKSGNADVVTGTPLSAWPVVTRGQVRELEHFYVRTVEQLAELADSHAQKFPGIQKLKQMAKDWLAQARDSSTLTQMRSELEQRDNALEVANRNIAALTARLDAVEAKASK